MASVDFEKELQKYEQKSAQRQQALTSGNSSENPVDLNESSPPVSAPADPDAGPKSTSSPNSRPAKPKKEKPMKTEINTASITVWLPPEVKKAVNRYCLEHDVVCSDWLREVIRKQVKDFM